MSPFDREQMFYSNYRSISCRFSDIQCRKISHLEIPFKSQSRSLKVVSFDRLDFLLVFYSYFVPKRYSTSNMPWPWKWVRVNQFHWNYHHSI